jgi:hypothetical protein
MKRWERASVIQCWRQDFLEGASLRIRSLQSASSGVTGRCLAQFAKTELLIIDDFALASIGQNERSPAGRLAK